MKKSHLLVVLSFFVALVGWVQMAGSTLNIRQLNGQIVLQWPVLDGDFVLEETPILSPQVQWTASTQTVRTNGSLLEVVVNPAAVERYYRLRQQPAVAAVTGIESTSPRDGESGVAVTSETVLRLTAPLSSRVTVGPAVCWAEFGGRKILSRVNLSLDRKVLTLFYLEPLPSSSRIRVFVDGNVLPDERGLALDADGDGKPGGMGVMEFETVSVTPVAGTAVVGTVFASELSPTVGGGFVNRPLANVTVTVDGAEQNLRTTTDVNGNFRLQPVPAGRFFVHVDGRTGAGSSWPNGDYYPVVGKAWDAVAGRQDNPAGGTGEIYLPRIPAGTLQSVSATEETVIMFPASITSRDPRLAGVSVTVPANSLFSENGLRGGRVGIAAVSPDRLPEALPAGLKFPLVITVQTDGPGNFDVPASVRFPNLPDPSTGVPLAPGALSALYSFNHDTGRWEMQGQMKVSADGKYVESLPGVGIRQPGWHAASPITTGDGPYDALPAPNPDPAVDAFLNQFIEAQSKSSTCAGNSADLAQDVLNLSDAVQTMLVLKGGLAQVQQAYAGGLIGSSAICAAISLTELQRPQLESLLARLRSGGGSSSVERVRLILGCVSNVIQQLEKHCNNLQTSPAGSIPPSVSKTCAAIPRAYQVMAVLDELGDYIVGFDINGLYAELESIKNYIGCASPAPAPANVGRATPDPVLVQKLEQFSARFSAFGGVTDSDWSFVGEFIDESNDTHDAVSGARPDLYLLVEAGGSVQRLRSNSFGKYQVFLPGGVYYSVSAYDASTGRCGRGWGKSAPPGLPTIIHGPPLGPCESGDKDGDGLSDFAENVVGTNPALTDTDKDGIPDGAELAQGMDPLDPKPLPAGLRTLVPTASDVSHVAADGDLVVVSEGASGVEIFNAFNGLKPVVVGHVPTAGTAVQAAVSGRWMAVAASSLAEFVDLDGANGPEVRRQIGFESGVQCVAAAGGVAYFGTGRGGVWPVHMATGVAGSELLLEEGQSIKDISIEGGMAYLLTEENLHAVRINGLEVVLEGTQAVTPGSSRIFVANRIGYLSHDNGFDVLDLRQPANPGVIKQNDTLGFGLSQIVTTSSGVGLGLTTRFPAELALFDFSDPKLGAVRKGSIGLPQRGNAFALDHGLAFVACGRAGLAVVNPAAASAGAQVPVATLAASFELSPAQAEANRYESLMVIPSGTNEIRSVDFYVDGRLVGSSGSPPFQHHFRIPNISSSQTSFRIKAMVRGVNGRESELPEIVVKITPDRKAPVVLGVSPADQSNSATSVQNIFVGFSEPIRSGSLQLVSAGADRKLGTADDIPVGGVTVESNEESPGFVARISPVGLPSGIYAGKVAAGLKDSAGNSQATDYTWTFAVQDFTPPRLLSAFPHPGSVVSGEIRRVQLTFSEPLSKATVRVTEDGPDGYSDTSDDQVVAGGGPEWNAAKTQLTLSFPSALAPRHYHVEVLDGVDASGNSAQIEPWEFVVPILTTISGRIQGPPGVALSGAHVEISGSDKRPIVASDGSFKLQQLQLDPGVRLFFSVTLTNGGRFFEARSVRVAPVHGGTTELGAVTLVETCKAGFVPDLFAGPGPEQSVSSLAQFDDGTGPALYVGLNSVTDPTLTSTRFPVQRWTGRRWEHVGGEFTGFEGVSTPAITAIAVYDDGHGPALYAGGAINSVQGIRVNGIARWDGKSWSAVGGGFGHLADSFIAVSAMAVHDDGSGPALYVAGSFNKAGGVSALNIAKWNGKVWAPLGTGLGQPIAAGFGAVSSMVSYKNELYVGGSIGTAGGVNVGSIARWNGQRWSALGSGIRSLSTFSVRSMALFNDELYVAGGLNGAGDVDASSVARWNGVRWAAAGAGLGFQPGAAGDVYSIAAATLNQKSELYALGAFSISGTNAVEGFARWDGVSWKSVGGTAPSRVSIGTRLLPITSPTGVGLVVAFDGFVLGPQLAGGASQAFAGKYVANWDGNRWSPIGAGLGGNILAMGEAGLGKSRQLYAGGEFVFAGPLEANNVAQWDGDHWLPVGTGLDGKVMALAEYQPQGGAAALYAAGEFQKAGTTSTPGISSWDGTKWTAVGDPLIYEIGRQRGTVHVTALKAYNDGTGVALYVAGFFNKAGSVAAQGIAKWNGSAWSAVGAGLDGTVESFVEYTDGTGKALYAGGQFAVLGSTGRRECAVAKWDGKLWLPLGAAGRTQFDQSVRSLVVFDDGRGPALYAGGSFNSIQGGKKALYGFARWTGSDWAGLGQGPGGNYGTINSLVVFDDGFGPRIFAGGSFDNPGRSSIRSVAAWDGNSWSPLGDGLDGTVNDHGVHAMIVHNDGQGAAVYFGGSFSQTGGKTGFVSHRAASWYRSSSPCPLGN